jgi:uncharacterized membrane protein YgcG
MAKTWRTSVLLVAVSLAPVAFAASGWDVPRPPAGRFVSDESGQLRPDTVTELQAIAEAINASDRGQLGVLVTRTTGGEAPRRFATDVFNAWGIGHAGRDDGVFIFLALDDRKAELIVGSKEPLVKRQTDAIMANAIVANMKRKDPDGAVLAAARAVQRELGAAAVQTETTPPPRPPSEVEERLGAYLRGEKPFPDRTPRSWVMDLTESLSASERAELDVLSNELYADGKGRLVFLNVSTEAAWPPLDTLVHAMVRQVEPTSKLPLAVVALNPRTLDGRIRLPAPLVMTSWEQTKLDEALREMTARRLMPNRFLLGGQFAAQALRTGIPPRPMSDVVREAFERFAAWLWGGLVALVVGGVWWLRRWLRNRPRVCETCHQPRERLAEDEDDVHLSEGQRAEEGLKSVDYDVWYCGRCDDTLVLDYSAFFSGYGKCQSCSFKTATSSSTTIQHATEYTHGLVRVTERCSHCSHVHSYERLTAKLQPRRSSSSSRSSSWSSSSSSSRSSGGFGGGRSSGGGSSGSW